MTLKNFIFNDLGENTFVLYDDTRQCIIVDPGCSTAREQGVLMDFITANGLKPVYIVNTHGHFDHIFGNAWTKSVFNCPLLIHKNDLPLLEHGDKFAGMFGFMIENSPMPDGYLEEGETLTFGTSALAIIHVPGHSPGSICLYSAESLLLIGGDVLFSGSIGRTDLPGGNHQLLISGILGKLMILPRETTVWPGHGPHTTIGHEHDTNPFLN